MELKVIQDKIYKIRGNRVMLDFDLAALYGVATKVFNQSVKRNIERFPEDFMFRLTEQEWEIIRSQMVINLKEQRSKSAKDTNNQQDGNWSQIVTSSSSTETSSDEGTESLNSSQIVMSSNKNRGKAYLPYAFTEHGVTMLASVLKSEKAVKMSIDVVRAFIALKQFAIEQNSLARQLQEIRDRLGEHDTQLNAIYDAIENILEEKVEKKSWEDRDRIGFRRQAS